MKKTRLLPLWLMASLSLITACGGGSTTDEPLPGTSPTLPVITQANVTINWDANREVAVNSLNGGYRLFYSTSSPVTVNDIMIDVPFNVNIQRSPTSTSIVLDTGATYYFAVQAYSALNPPSGSQSILSSEFSLAIN